MLAVRPAVAADAPRLLQLMRQLAVFEGYDAQFRVTEHDLLRLGLANTIPARFAAFVAQQDGAPACGYAVTYEIPFTYDLRPTLVLKELYVEEAARGCGAGEALMRRVFAHAGDRGAARLQWDVLPGNEAAKRFYRRLGGSPVTDWERWHRDIAPEHSP
ncbi:GNAT family N-acetyltransferase [Ramlibacter sp.]|uniref:GNAT family N-acetyltransferase n=1 Tax=Ramlibacter sp. TaxID=1917967 RepID=UPI0017DF635F|nr:GNAT family N-acetyltransferase [Ramlibacter sp.]MBA2673881.1 GNAT family N-acetyltransferase [Ramlibacter sp.]